MTSGCKYPQLTGKKFWACSKLACGRFGISCTSAGKSERDPCEILTGACQMWGTAGSKKCPPQLARKTCPESCDRGLTSQQISVISSSQTVVHPLYWHISLHNYVFTYITLNTNWADEWFLNHMSAQLVFNVNVWNGWFTFAWINAYNHVANNKLSNIVHLGGSWNNFDHKN